MILCDFRITCIQRRDSVTTCVAFRKRFQLPFFPREGDLFADESGCGRKVEYVEFDLSKGTANVWFEDTLLDDQISWEFTFQEFVKHRWFADINNIASHDAAAEASLRLLAAKFADPSAP